MLRAEQAMRDQISRDEDCSEIAEELLHMRAVMSEMVKEREGLGDREPIQVERFFIPRRPLYEKPQKPVGSHKRHPVLRA